MKKITLAITLTVFIVVISGCEKILNVEPVSKLSGNNFWKSAKDVEDFTRDLYRLFRSASTNSVMIIQADYRCAPAKASDKAFPVRHDFNYLPANNLRKALAADWTRKSPNYDVYVDWFAKNARYDLITNWKPFYRVIQEANILYEIIDDVDDPTLSDKAKRKYKAEAVFLRCLSYFFMVRLYGDVPYYTAAFHEDPLPRTNMVTVLKNCIADLSPVEEDLPWTYEDPADKGSRAMRGGALALLMHMNMWCAGFDKTNAQTYYQEVSYLGNILHNEGVINNAAYRLYPIEESSEVFKGRSSESLFEIPQSFNYGELTSNDRFRFSFSVLHAPYRGTNPHSELVFYSDYMKRIYPEAVSDKRKTQWFDEFIYDESGLFQYFKFFNIFNQEGRKEKATDDSFIIFRLAGAYLLQAEAEAELDNTENATILLNRVRARAEAAPFPSDPGEGNLKDAIYWERCKELMGEGHYFYDLVRTQKIVDPRYCYNPLSYSDFAAGAWTWPIDVEALKFNPHMTLNYFWE